MKALFNTLAAFLVFLALPAIADTPKIAMEEFKVPALDPGITLYVRNKHPVGMKSPPAERILLFVHGATYPAETAFDLRLNGLSWMEYIAQHGYDVYLLDLRGYGQSTRPAEMAAPAEQNAPIVRTETAVKDVEAAVEFIRRRRGVQKLNLMGWSWGTSIMGWYTAQHNDRVVKLVQYAPLWLAHSPSLLDTSTKLGAYRIVTREAAKARWLNGVPEDKQADLIPAGWFEAWADATYGVVADGRDFWGAGKPLYDPAEIRVPTFLAHAEWDADLPSYMLYAYFEKLVNAPYKRYVQIGEGTHNIMMEKNRMQLFETVQQFLDDKVQLAQ
jgi:pimeloyl-ACP methyl ester carboxylesterase